MQVCLRNNVLSVKMHHLCHLPYFIFLWGLFHAQLNLNPVGKPLRQFHFSREIYSACFKHSPPWMFYCCHKSTMFNKKSPLFETNGNLLINYNLILLLNVILILVLVHSFLTYFDLLVSQSLEQEKV